MKQITNKTRKLEEQDYFEETANEYTSMATKIVHGKLWVGGQLENVEIHMANR